MDLKKKKNQNKLKCTFFNFKIKRFIKILINNNIYQETPCVSVTENQRYLINEEYAHSQVLIEIALKLIKIDFWNRHKLSGYEYKSNKNRKQLKLTPTPANWGLIRSILIRIIHTFVRNNVKTFVIHQCLVYFIF